MPEPEHVNDGLAQEQIHDLKNRLTVVKGLAQLLERQVRRDDWQRDRILARVDSLQLEISRLESLMDDMSGSDSIRHSEQFALSEQHAHDCE